jgi:hypothetical protein
MNELYKKSLYTIKANWLVHEIFEYDISKANISILLQYGYISPTEYNMYAQMSKNQRQIAIGRLQKIPKYNKAIADGFEEARKALIDVNSINEEDIVSIKKDAMYVMKRLSVTNFGHIHFTLRGTYSIFISCMGLELYFYYDEFNDEYDIQVKGINDDLLSLHEEFLSIICTALRKVQQGDITSALNYINTIRSQYLNRELPIECYREFNRTSLYMIDGCNYGVMNLTEHEKEVLKDHILLNWNNLFLTEFGRILFEMLFSS